MPRLLLTLLLSFQLATQPLLAYAPSPIPKANDTYDLQEEHKFKQSGLSVAISGGVVDTIKTATSSAKRIETAKDERLKAVNAWRLARVAQDIPKGINKLDNLGNDFSDPFSDPTKASKPAESSGVNLSVSIGSSSSEQTVTQHDETALGSSLLAQNEINITARGSGDDDYIPGGQNPTEGPTGGDINMQGALLEAANINLNANNAINLKSAENIHDRQEDSESKSAGIGISIGSDGLLFFVEASVARGEVNQSSDKYLETLINASDKVSMLSGGDTTLEGAQVTAPRIEVESGGDLNIISQQDQEHYSNDQQSAGFKVAAGYGRWSVSVNASQLEADSDYVAVQEQSGLFAGDYGYNVEVEGNTHLDGGAIVSSADPENNRLSTDTLSHNSIHNYAKYDVDAKSISFSTSGTYGAGGTSVTSSPTKGLGGGFANESGEAENTTYAAISPGEVTIRSNPEQDLSGIKRSQEEAHQVLERIFSEDKIDQALETVELTQIFAEEGYIAVGKLYDGLTKAEARLEAAENAPDAYPQEVIDDLRLAVEQERAKLPMDKAVAHALIGGITAILGGGNFVQGAMAAGLNEAAASALKEQLPDNALLRNAAAVLIGGIVGGGNGALIAGNADQFNRQLHLTEIDQIKQHAKEYAKQLYGSNPTEEQISEASVQLFEQAMRQTDTFWESLFQENKTASEFLAGISSDDQLFTATQAEKDDFTINLSTLLSNRDVFEKVVLQEYIFGWDDDAIDSAQLKMRILMVSPDVPMETKQKLFEETILAAGQSMESGDKESARENIRLLSGLLDAAGSPIGADAIDYVDNLVELDRFVAELVTAGVVGRTFRILHSVGATAPLSQVEISKIKALPKGQRPDPSEYLSKNYMDDHLAEFDGGATRFMTKANFDKYGIGQRDGTSFVMTKKQADQVIASTNGDPRAMEKALGLPENFLDGNTLIRIDIPNPRGLNVRIPSGNEAGANDLWVPGGKLPDGNLEAVIDVEGIAPTRYQWTSLQF